MTRMTGPDCVVMCNLINTYIHTYIHTYYIHTYIHVCYKCGDLHANLSRHSSGCDRTPSDTMPPHFDGLGGEPSARNPDTPSTPAAENFNQSEQSSPSILLPWGIEHVRPMLDALDRTTLARMFLSTAKAVRQEHRMPFARSLRHALRISLSAPMLYR